MWSQNLFPTAEMVEAGLVVGPRVFSTGDPLYAGYGSRQEDFTSAAIAEAGILKLKHWGAVSLTQYQQPRRDQRQWVMEAARKHGMQVTSENGDLEYTLGMIMDGHTGFEHPMSYTPLYAGFVIACGCLTQTPLAEDQKSTVPAGLVSDAGLRIITEEFPPLNYAGADGKAAGQASETVTSLLTRLNQTASIEIMPWSEAYTLARTGPQVALLSTARTDERENLFKWVGPIASSEYML